MYGCDIHETYTLHIAKRTLLNERETHTSVHCSLHFESTETAMGVVHEGTNLFLIAVNREGLRQVAVAAQFTWSSIPGIRFLIFIVVLKPCSHHSEGRLHKCTILY